MCKVKILSQANTSYTLYLYSQYLYNGRRIFMSWHIHMVMTLKVICSFVYLLTKSFNSQKTINNVPFCGRWGIFKFLRLPRLQQAKQFKSIYMNSVFLNDCCLKTLYSSLFSYLHMRRLSYWKARWAPLQRWD